MGFFKPKIEKMAAKGDVDGLTKALFHKDRVVQTAAFLHLRDFGKDAMPGLIEALQKGDEHLRSNAALSLGYIGPVVKAAVPTLTKALQDEDKGVRRDAAEALGEIGDTRAVEPLTKALKDETLEVQGAAKEALEKIKTASKIGGSFEKILRWMGFPKGEITNLASLSPSLFTKLTQLADELVSREQSRASKLGRKEIELSPWAHEQVTEMVNVMVKIRVNIPWLELIRKPVWALDKFARAVDGNPLLAHAYVVKAVEETVKRTLEKIKAEKS
jgi:hypothetical protein